MLQVFQSWGMPKSIRTDNGEPFGVPTRDVVPMMSLWLKAWDIQPILNRPRQPQDNPHVESNQGTCSRWAEVYQCHTIEQMQDRLDEACAIQRDLYPVSRIGNAPRKKVFPNLYEKPRPFEKVKFDENKAYNLLSKVVYPRKVCSRGSITLYSKKFQVGYKYRNQVLFIKFDPKKMEWLCLNKNQTIVYTINDQRMLRANLFNLNLCQ